MRSAEDFLIELVACNSVSGQEQVAAECALRRMKELGYRDCGIDQAGNCIGYWGMPGAPRVMLVGHIDTVPGEIPIHLEDAGDETILYGRGSVDAKGPFATFVEAVGSLPREVPLELVVVGAVEEEVSSSKGARHLLQTFDQPQAVIIGEPSNLDGITLGYRGRVSMATTYRRAMSHSSTCDHSVGDRFVEVASKIQDFCQRSCVGKDGIFDSLHSTVQSLQVQSDGLYESGELSMGFRFGPSWTSGQLKEVLADLAAPLDLHFTVSEEPAQFSSKTSLAQVFRVAIREQGLTPRHVLKSGTSDMNVLAAQWKVPMVAYGPGDSDLDHTPNEHISLSDYAKAQRVLAGALLRAAEVLNKQLPATSSLAPSLDLAAN